MRRCDWRWPSWEDFHVPESGDVAPTYVPPTASEIDALVAADLRRIFRVEA